MALTQNRSYYVLVVVECTEFGSYDISFTNDVTVDRRG